MTNADRETLRASLCALGFDEVRFASAGARVGGDFPGWLEAGHAADMDWLERGCAKRLDPQLVLPGVQTIIALGVNHLPDGAAACQGRWAKYALWSDYHDTVGKGLREAGILLERQLGLTREDYRAYVDTGPLLERGWAAAAGMGWQGKNAMLLSRTHGNWLFLAAILVRAQITPDVDRVGSAQGCEREQAAHAFPGCGTCTRCLDACPTRAFPRPGWVDARRCISYHTIENRGCIPEELRVAIGPRVFGCDRCLDVCPWNRFAQAARSSLLVARSELAELSLPDLLAMEEEQFREVFRRTPIKRTKLAGLLRNACIAAGNWHDSDDWHFGGAENVETVIGAVERLTGHESAVVREHAAWARNRLLEANPRQD